MMVLEGKYCSSIQSEESTQGASMLAPILLGDLERSIVDTLQSSVVFEDV